MMFQNNSISVDNPDFLVMDLIHQLEVNPDLTASQIVEEFKEGRCFDGKVFLKHKLPPQRAKLVMEANELRKDINAIKERVSRYISLVVENELGEMP